jgi:uncharacterized SAM-binding protein YcdF (DUF218 family)
MSLWGGAARGFALFFGGFALLNLVGELRHPGFDANLWWIDLRPVDPRVSQSILGVTAVLWIAYGIRTRCRSWRRLLTGGLTMVLLAMALANLLMVYSLALQDAITVGCPVAFSLVVVGALALVLVRMWISPLTTRAHVRREVLVAGLTVGVCLLGFPLAQMYCFGTTDYRRPADVVVVFGARVYADGRASDALADRVRTGCSLYRDGLVRKVVLSGGPGDGDIHETEGMRRLAVQLGVPAEDILIDEQGLSTQETVRHTCPLFDRYGLHRVLVVSHFYHLPRIKLTYQRQGREVYTVPAKETYPLTALPLYMLREVAALWVYYLRPLCPGWPE